MNNLHQTNKILLDMCEQLGKALSTCKRRQIGCLIFNDTDGMVAMGVNRTPTGHEECFLKGCLRDERNIDSGTELETCRAVHAEMQAILRAGNKARGGELYVNTSPCPICARMIIAAGIKKVCYRGEYANNDGLKTLEHYGVEVEKCE